MLIKLCPTNVPEIHLLFDGYLTPSIKDSEHHSRQEFYIPYRITGPLHPRPTDFLECLKNYRFKEALIQFFGNYWEKNNLVSIIQEKKNFITFQVRIVAFLIIEREIVL